MLSFLSKVYALLMRLRWPGGRNIFGYQRITDISQEVVYLYRWDFNLPFGGLSLKLHRILRPDADRCPHDHPWWFIRVILVGGYVEQRGPHNKLYTCKPWRPWAPFRVYYCPSDFRHRIDRLLGRENWSICLMGPKVQEWGFFTREGWMLWRTFVNEARSKRVLWCDDGTALNAVLACPLCGSEGHKHCPAHREPVERVPMSESARILIAQAANNCICSPKSSFHFEGCPCYSRPSLANPRL